MKLINRRVEGIYNMMESVVWKVFEEEIAQTEQNMCLCSQCKLDIVTYSLNRLPAFYVSSEEGESRFPDSGIRTLVHQTVTDAVHHISQNPHRARTMTEYSVNELFSYIRNSQ